MHGLCSASLMAEYHTRQPYNKALTIQTLIMSKTRFKTVSEAAQWVRDHGFKARHQGKGPDETQTSYRFRQRDPGDFRPGRFRTIELTRGVKAVMGELK